jgi:RimJ/RimL family protein N-acetyltransferase
MKHDLQIEGIGFIARPVHKEDAPLIVKLRTNPELNKYIHSTSNDIDSQLLWLDSYFSRQNDFYFAIQRKNSEDVMGFASIYNFDSSKKSAEWGRWIMSPGSLAAVESALLIYRCAFEALGLEEVYSRTAAINKAVVSFHDSCNIPKSSILPDYYKLGHGTVDAVEHRVNLQVWGHIAPQMESIATKIANRFYS